MRRWSGILLAILALLSTFVFGLSFYQMSTGEPVGYEVTLGWAFTALIGVISAGLWAGTFSALSKEKQRRRTMDLLGIGAVLALLAGVAVGLITDTTDDLTLEITMTTDALEGYVICSHPGLPGEVTAGEIEVVFRNQSTVGGTGWMYVVRLDEDKTFSDAFAHIESGESGNPDWTTGVYLADLVPTGSSTEPVTKIVQPGLHIVACGTNTPYESQFAGTFTALP
jgi:hypothetical protein